MKKIPVVDPATEKKIGEIAEAGKAGVDKAVARAKKAFKEWRLLPAHTKAEKLHEVAHVLRKHADELAELLTKEGGKPFRENVDEMGWSASCFDYYAELPRGSKGRVIAPTENSQLNMVVKEPYGVIGAIVPWNYPILLTSWKLAPALAAGNCVILKPAEQTPLSTLRWKELLGDILPEGVLEVVTGGGETGEAIVRHPDVAMVAFTGSLETGKKVAHICADQTKKCHLELGGKDAFVVCEDSDIDVAVKAVAWASFLNAGQVCTSAERVYVHESISKKFIERIADFTKSLKLGSGMDPNTDVGPMVRGEYRKKVETHIAQAVSKGAKVLAGGKIPKGTGYFFEPTVLVDVKQDMQVMRDETFGPVCPIMTYKTFDQAIELVNDCIYGLGADIFTHDSRKVKRFFEEVQAGTIWINDPLTDNDAGPFGGYKSTGGGRELGEEGLEEFQQTKHIHWDFEQKVKPWFYPYAPTSKDYKYGKN